MRKPKFLSFSALWIYDKNPEEYAQRYLTDVRAPREPQSEAASAGSAFDAYEKNALHWIAYGHNGKDNEYSLDALMEDQVDEGMRDWAWPVGKYLFDCYKLSGMHQDLVRLIAEADTTPRFEFDVTGEIEGVPIFGKPDCEFTRKGTRIILDWKVMGFQGKKSGVSPYKGYRLCRDGYGGDKPSQSHGKTHAAYIPREVGDLELNTLCLEDSNDKWADQLCIYGWTLGNGEVGDDTVYMIDQLVCKPMPEGYPLIRVANFRARVRVSYQRYVADRLKRLWNAVQTEHIFQDLTKEESDQQMWILNETAKRARLRPNSPIARFSRPVFRG